MLDAAGAVSDIPLHCLRRPSILTIDVKMIKIELSIT